MGSRPEQALFLTASGGTPTMRSSSLRVEKQAGDEDDHDGQELQEAHPDEGVREEVLLHRRIARHAHYQGGKELADTLRTAPHSNHCDGAAEDRDAGVALAEGRSETHSGDGSRCLAFLERPQGRRGEESAGCGRGRAHSRSLGQDAGSPDHLEGRHLDKYTCGWLLRYGGRRIGWWVL